MYIIAIAGSLAIAPSISAQAAVGGPPVPVESAYIPGLGGGAPLRNLVVGEEDTIWNPPPMITNLGKSRILAKELSPSNPSFMPFASDNELFYGMFNVCKKMHMFLVAYLFFVFDACFDPIENNIF